MNAEATSQQPSTVTGPLEDGTVYSSRKNFQPFSVPDLNSYAELVSERSLERLQTVAGRLKGLKLLEINATAQGGGVAEILYSYIPFLNSLGIDAEWKVIHGTSEYYEVTKALHNMLQGKDDSLSPEMVELYVQTLESAAQNGLIDYDPDAVIVHDPQPMGLASYLKDPKVPWMWRCHIDVDEAAIKKNPTLWDFVSRWASPYCASVYSGAHNIVGSWSMPKFIIPPFIDPLSDKNKPLSQVEIESVLTKYGIDSSIPIVAQISRFDPWKGIDRTLACFKLIKKETKCQLILAGGFATDDPEGERFLARFRELTHDDEDIHILNLSLEDRKENWLEVNALQRAASVIMAPSTREGFGLVITEALWKAKPVISSNVGSIPLQIHHGKTGYFYEGPQTTARRIISLLKNPASAESLGQRAREYVRRHFILPTRVVDYLMALELLVHKDGKNGLPHESIISFHPWLTISKQR
jgi:trehalose synthase